MRKVGFYAIIILAILASSTLIQWTALTTPTLIQPTAATEPECHEGKRCIDSQWKSCVGDCLEQYYGPDIRDACKKCIQLITSLISCVAGSLISIISPSAGTIYAIILSCSTAGFYALEHTDECLVCQEAYEQIQSCLSNCQCSQWENVLVCP